MAYTTKISQIQVDRNAENLDASQDSNILTYGSTSNFIIRYGLWLERRYVMVAWIIYVNFVAEDAYRAQNGLSLCRYDAFILFSDDDASFASEIISRMENDYQLKVKGNPK